MFLLTKTYGIFGAALFCVITLFPAACGKICISTDVRNHVKNLNKLRNCTEITGDLLIVLLENTKSESDYDPYVFPELQKVTGFVLLYKLKHFTSLGKLFPNLRLIRGLTLLKNYALIIYDVPNIREVGTSKLSYIARGYVKVGKTPNLCYVDTVEWQKIGQHIFLHYQKYRQDCPACPAYCNGHCWNHEQCQVFTDNCHLECLGCTKNNSNAHCEVCKNYENNGICVAECPPDKYTLQVMGKCVSLQECFARNNAKPNQTSLNTLEKWFVYNGECRSDCPEETKYNTEINSCEPCGNKCVKYCPGTEYLNNQIVIENMKGCTHINGSLSILNLVNKEDRAALYINLRSLRYIRDYLLIARNEVIEDLQFLSNLTEIGGVNLYANKSLFAYDNRNLKNLWNISQSFQLKIKNGNIGFHDNEQLCLTEIERFAEKVGIKYSDTDVSKYSNGAYCREGVDTGLVVNVKEVNTKNVTIVWERKYGNDELYYTVHYTDSNTTEERQQDVCSATGWDTFSTVNNSAQLVGLNVFRTYYFYIKTYLKNMEAKKTSIKTFQTLPDDPDSPSTFAAYPIDHHSIRLVWTKPYRSNGNLSSYLISIYREGDDLDITKKRDYCANPFSDAKSKTDDTGGDDYKGVGESSDFGHHELKEMYDLGPAEVTYPDEPCSPTNVEVNIRLENNIWLYLCDKNSQSKFGINYCKNYYYDYFSNSSDIQIHKRSGEKTSSRKKSNSTFPSGYFFAITVGANATNYTISNLNQFSLYVFYIKACNENFKGRELCSSVLQTSARTLKNPNADNVSGFSVKIENQVDLIITWTVPKNPNAFIVAYNIYYRKDLKHSKNQTECISQARFIKEKNLTLRNMLPGGYFLMVQAISLAGPGHISEMKYIDIRVSSYNSVWVIVALIFVLTISLIAIMVFFRIKRRRLLDNIQLIAHINPEYSTLEYEADEWEMDRDDIELHNIIGQGTFGRVFLGHIKSKNMACAVKTVNEEASFQERRRFLAEASTMKEFTKGTHVVKLYGVVSKLQPPLVVMELMERGDLKKYLLRLGDSSQCITSNEIYRMSIEIADGVAYLTSRKYVHRDLAARNCMVSNDRTVKIGDFGMTRDIYQSDYYKKGSGNALLPVRWMAPESIADGVNTYDSDIWSYGIVLWEIVTLASQPYQGLSNEEVTQFVVSKGTLDRPAECPNLLWEIMRKCWDWYPTRRPTCFEIIETLQDHVGRDFKSLSFYHSTNGQEYLISHGSVRPQNPPALAIGDHRFDENPASENDPLSIPEEATSQPVDPEFIPPSSPQQVHSSFGVDVEMFEQKPLVTDSEDECETHL